MSASRPTTLPASEDKGLVVRRMFDRIAPRYDLLNRLLTFGLDMGWRRKAVEDMELAAGARVVDLACGTGDFCRLLGGAGLRPVGVDFSRGMLAIAKTDAPLVQADVLRLPFADGSLDGATCGFAMRNVVDLAGLFTETARVLRPGGRVAMLDVGDPTLAPLRWGHAIWFRRVVPVLGGLVSDREAYRYLPESTAYLPSAGELLRMLVRAGFPDARRIVLGAGVTQLVVGTRA